ncbi:MAG: hypothetical protein ABIG61_17700 [Planctomycetota bacterium]
MSLEKIITHDHSITELGHIQVRRITRIMEDGKELSKSYHRHVVSPGDDLTGEDERTVSLAKTIHTPEVIAAYKAVLEENIK